jgi:hypothetical protein
MQHHSCVNRGRCGTHIIESYLKIVSSWKKTIAVASSRKQAKTSRFRYDFVPWAQITPISLT